MPERMNFAIWEMIVMRAVFAWILIPFILTEPPVFSSVPYPNGLAHLMDLSFLRDPGTVHILSLTAQACLVLGMLGVAEPLTLGWLLFVIVASKSYNQSQGNLGHAGQLVTLCLLAQWLASVRALLPGASGLRGLLWGGADSWRRQIWWLLQALAVGYTVSAITKLINSHGMWPFRGSAFLLQIYKAQTEMLVSQNVSLGPLTVAITDFIANHQWFGTVMLIPTWLLEFGGFVILINRRLSLLMGAMLIGFHHMTALMMGIPFMEHRQMLWLFAVNPAYWLVYGVRWVVAWTKQPRQVLQN